MNAADLARLELAKRAYRAAQPSDTEIQTGVRRARLSLTRPKARRAWFSKGLVFIVLAIGSLAYAKPHAIGEIVEKVLPRDAATNGKRASGGAASAALEAATKPGSTAGQHAASGPPSVSPAPEQSTLSTPPPISPSAQAAASKKAAVTSRAATTTTSNVDATGAASAAGVKGAAVAATGAKNAAAASVTDWGRVGQALARGDETEALSALSELSESADQRTRDKADLGRAQLFMAHGDPDKACALARALTNRRAGSRIERQAQLLLKSCTR